MNWISVKDRLPEIDGEYFVYFNSQRDKKDVWISPYYDVIGFVMPFVTHWMKIDENNWIDNGSIKPDKHGFYAVYTTEDYVEGITTLIGYFNLKESWITPKSKIDKWMPLPESPKELDGLDQR